jgi:MinD superfamily P-loop ATPase
MDELVIISGKGGTGKTSVTASFAALADNAVIADCDVDAADLHLVLAPSMRRSAVFKSGHCAEIRQEDCGGCGVCLAYCRYDAVQWNAGQDDGAPVYRIDPLACEGCGVCVRMCPRDAIDFPESVTGEWYVSDTRFGPLVHARLGIAAENSGKLVSLVRREARALAEAEGRGRILVDGPPGIGCPVIASITGASRVLVVTEPTKSGMHDFERALAVARHFRVPGAVCVNKWDLNPGVTEEIEAKARAAGAEVAGRIRYDRAVTRAQVEGVPVVLLDGSGAAEDIRALWNSLECQPAHAEAGTNSPATTGAATGAGGERGG